MAILVHITDECLSDARKHSCLADVEKFKDRIRIDQRLSLFDNFPPPYLKKRFRQNFRLIAEERFIGDHTVVLFYRLLVRSSQDYRNFYNNPIEYGKRNFAMLASESDIADFVDKETKSNPPPPKPKPSKLEQDFLWRASISKTDLNSEGGHEYLVCESEDWVKWSASENIKNRLLYYREPIFDALGSDDETEITVRENGMSFVFRYFDSLKKILLIAPFTSQNLSAKPEIVERYSSILKIGLKDVTDEEVLRHSARTYPIYLLEDEDGWEAVQRDSEANMALSPEETRILESVRFKQKRNAETGYPLFINGRAGSGKSTILQYLFADYLSFYIKNTKNIDEKSNLHLPVYFTCSQDLLDRAERNVRTILTLHHDKLSDETFISESVTGNAFQEFHKFLYDLLPKEDRLSHFSLDKYVDYPRFKQMWREKFGQVPEARNNWGPDISWHVMRTYIKGLSCEIDAIDLEEYTQLPRKQKSVSHDRYSIVFKKVWDDWYKPLCNKQYYWDDQDLARKALDLNLVTSKYSAVFCDEAQDFTRIELEILFRLNIFSDRLLQSHELDRVPFVFAGDQFQTLNPTGFRWESMKAAYVEKFIHNLDPGSRSRKKELNYRELSFNYRSTSSIVRLCNTILLLRKVLLKAKNLQPQESWQFELTSPEPVYFNQSDGDVGLSLKKESDIMIILPCAAGEEIDFVENDERLKRIVKRDKTGVPQNAMSAMRAKGLEFNRVLVYGFGEACPIELNDLNIFDDDSVELDNELTVEYFFNQLYVAVSRAKKRLFIMDTDRGMQGLWSIATDKSIMESLLDKTKDAATIWRKQIGILDSGSLESLSEEREDPLTNGVRLEKQGRLENDAYHMRSAAQYFEDAGESSKALECRAFAYIYDREFLRAGDLFIEGKNWDQAVKAFWTKRSYPKVVELAEKYRLNAKPLECRMAAVLVDGSEPSIDIAIEMLRTVVDEMDSNPNYHEECWVVARQELVRKLLDSEQGQGNKVGWKHLSALLNGLVPETDNLAKVKYLAGEMETAVAIWDKINKADSTEYREAKIATLRFPDNLPLLHQDHNAATIIDQHKAHVETRLSLAETQIVASAYMQHGRMKEACDLAIRARDIQTLKSILIQAAQDPTGQRQEGLQAARHIADLLLREGRWQEGINFLDRNRLRDTPAKDYAKLKKFLKNSYHALPALAIKTLARSDALPQLPMSIKRKFSDYLNTLLIKEKMAWVNAISPEEGGAAIERAGRHIDALKFYEILKESDSFPEEVRQRASARWVKCKLKQAKWASENHQKDADRFRSQADEGLVNLKLEEKNLPDFPTLKDIQAPLLDSTDETDTVTEEREDFKLDRIKTRNTVITQQDPQYDDTLSVEGKKRQELTPVQTESPPPSPISNYKPTSWSKGSLQFTYDARKKQLKITELDSSHVSFIHKVGVEYCSTGDVNFVGSPEGTGKLICSEWRLACDFGSVEEQETFEIKFMDDDFLIKCKI